MKFTNSESVGEEIDVPAYWGKRGGLTSLRWREIADNRMNRWVYVQTFYHLDIPTTMRIRARSDTIKNKISQEIER